MVQNFTETINTAIATLKEEQGEEIEENSQRVKRLDEKDECGTENMVIDRQMHGASEEQLTVIVRNLPEKENENVKNEVNGMLRDGLKLRNVTVERAEGQTNGGNDFKYEVIVAKLRNKHDKQQVMKIKSKLKDSSKYD